MSVFQQLYDSEINFAVSSFWDGGFDVRLGDELNGYVSQTRVETWSEVEQRLRAEAQFHYPESQFTKAVLSSL